MPPKKRPERSQSAHNAEVRRQAKDFEERGYDVQADVSGFPQPDTIGGMRPDVVAKKGKRREIVEVETPNSVDSARDQRQQKAFRQAAKRAKGTTFRRVITDE